MIIIDNIFLFIGWNLLLGFIHYLAHRIPWLWNTHSIHHQEVIDGLYNRPQWTALFLWIDSWDTTKDLWKTEYIPTIIYCFIFNCWWIGILYYIWVATVQEWIEHNPRFNLYPFISSGRYHLIHHKDPTVNFASMVPWADWIMGTSSSKGLNNHINL